jgi:hypothetical protein
MLVSPLNSNAQTQIPNGQSRIKELFEFFPALRGIVLAADAQAFDNLLEAHIQQCVEIMEAEAHHLKTDSEEKLSAFLAATLQHPGLKVYREGYSNGRVDLTIQQEVPIGGHTRLAEAKIYNGPSYHTKAMTQLISRYSTGRQQTGYVIEYFKKSGIQKLVAELRSAADSKLPLEQTGPTEDHSMKWAYKSNHRHSSKATLRVVHVNVNLHHP